MQVSGQKDYVKHKNCDFIISKNYTKTRDKVLLEKDKISVQEAEDI
jgi:hypothetical protein